MKANFIKLLLTLLIVIPVTANALSPGEGIVLDPSTGDYLINYIGEKGRLIQSRFEPSTKIDPTLLSAFSNQNGLIRYSYIVRNGIKGKQPLIGLEIDGVSNIQSSTYLPKTWQETDLLMKKLAANPAQLEQMISAASNAVEKPKDWSCHVMPLGETLEAGFRIPCSFDNLDDAKHNGLQLGQTQAGFGFASLDLPGIGAGHLTGFGDMGPSFVDEGPSDEGMSNQLNRLQFSDFVALNAAVPTIAVPVPFDAAVLLDRIRSQILSWPNKQLLNSTFATQLDHHLVAAADAYRHNQIKAVREHIQTLHDMLKREDKELENEWYEDKRNEIKNAQHVLINQLAARVLDFDLRYVLKRLDRDEDTASR